MLYYSWLIKIIKKPNKYARGSYISQINADNLCIKIQSLLQMQHMLLY